MGAVVVVLDQGVEGIVEGGIGPVGFGLLALHGHGHGRERVQIFLATGHVVEYAGDADGVPAEVGGRVVAELLAVGPQAIAVAPAENLPRRLVEGDRWRIPHPLAKPDIHEPVHRQVRTPISGELRCERVRGIGDTGVVGTSEPDHVVVGRERVVEGADHVAAVAGVLEVEQRVPSVVHGEGEGVGGHVTEGDHVFLGENPLGRGLGGGVGKNGKANARARGDGVLQRFHRGVVAPALGGDDDGFGLSAADEGGLDVHVLERVEFARGEIDMRPDRAVDVEGELVRQVGFGVNELELQIARCGFAFGQDDVDGVPSAGAFGEDGRHRFAGADVCLGAQAAALYGDAAAHLKAQDVAVVGIGVGRQGQVENGPPFVAGFDGEIELHRLGAVMAVSGVFRFGDVLRTVVGSHGPVLLLLAIGHDGRVVRVGSRCSERCDGDQDEDGDSGREAIHVDYSSTRARSAWIGLGGGCFLAIPV